MKLFTIIILVLLGLYWLFDHTAPLPFNHEQFGLYQHNLHRILGIAFLIIAIVVWKKWTPKK